MSPDMPDDVELTEEDKKALVEQAMQDDFMRLVTSTEPLHPDLVPWYEEDGEFGPSLRHPLVYDVMGVRPGLANRRYEVKKRLLTEALEKGNWHSYVFLHERPYRAKALWDLTQKVPEKLALKKYCELVNKVWTDSENIHQNLDLWEELLADLDTPIARRFLMDDEEWEKYQALPEWITVYRGCISDLNEDGLSWTLDRDRAAWFARRASCRPEEADDLSHPTVLVGTVAKSNVIAYFAGRNESEIVIAHDGEVVIERLEEP